MPVEMGGLTEFPRIGDQPYFLTLGPYASYWFTLQREPLQIAQTSHQVSPRGRGTRLQTAITAPRCPRALLAGTD